MTHQLINHYLDEERKLHHMTMKQFVEGVFSVRTYRRYINEGREIPYQKLKKLLLKLFVNPFGFLYSIQATLVAENPDELNLLMALIHEDYELANNLIHKRENQPFVTFFGEYAIPLHMIMLDVYNKKTTIEKAKSYVLQSIKIDMLVNQTFITHEPIQALNRFVEWIPSHYLKNLYLFIKKVIDGEYSYHFSIYRIAMANLYSLYLKLTYLLYEEDELINDTLDETIQAFHTYGLELYMYDVMIFLANDPSLMKHPYRQSIIKKYLLPSIDILNNPQLFIKRIPIEVYQKCLKEENKYE